MSGRSPKPRQFEQKGAPLFLPEGTLCQHHSVATYKLSGMVEHPTILLLTFVTTSGVGKATPVAVSICSARIVMGEVSQRI